MSARRSPWRGAAGKSTGSSSRSWRRRPRISAARCRRYPFRPERIEIAKGGGGQATQSKIAEHEKRIKEPLEAFPLESIQMLGTITQEKETFALVKAGPNLYRVRKGMYMGQNFGVITVIDEAQITLKELVQDSGGEWIERSSSLQLVEAKR